MTTSAEDFPSPQKISLDDLYRMVAYIYSERNAERPISVTFAHFVEVCGMLSVHERPKKKEGITIADTLCKALGWFFPLIAKFNVKSVEDLVFRKYPRICPYCRKSPHKDAICKTVKGTSGTVDHQAVREHYEANRVNRPVGLNDWQSMFNDIYPRSVDSQSALLGLFEELGELAEAIRVFEKYPKYFAGEAADVFSYLMGIANEHTLRVKQNSDVDFSFESEFIKRYPGICVQCGYQVCLCPVIPEATVGRLAKELEISGEPLFGLDPVGFSEGGSAVASDVLDRLGGLSAVADKFPFDRGEINRSLVLLCVHLSQAIKEKNADLSQQLLQAAAKVGTDTKAAGTRVHAKSFEEVFAILEKASPLINPAILPRDKTVSGGLARLVQVDACRFGIITALPKEFAAVTTMLDNSFEYSVVGDPNGYTIGTIPAKDGSGEHFVVVTLLRDMGNNSAASAASHLLRSFAKVQDVLMVGIAGGIPSPNDPDKHVRLGDVVISDREGVVQYDNLKRESHDVKIRSASSKPSARMLGRVRHLEAERIKGYRPWTQYTLRGSAIEDGVRPANDQDRLFVMRDGEQVELQHPEDSKRVLGEPKIHYGRIGAANTLLKDPKLRDSLGSQENVRAIEMEGSGIEDGTWNAGQHYILIRGISDYCDGSKNDIWQGYAAVVAASYARALIESLPTEAGLPQERGKPI